MVADSQNSTGVIYHLLSACFLSPVCRFFPSITLVVPSFCYIENLDNFPTPFIWNHLHTPPLWAEFSLSWDLFPSIGPWNERIGYGRCLESLSHGVFILKSQVKHHKMKFRWLPALQGNVRDSKNFNKSAAGCVGGSLKYVFRQQKSYSNFTWVTSREVSSLLELSATKTYCFPQQSAMCCENSPSDVKDHEKTILTSPDKIIVVHADDNYQQLRRWPTLSQAIDESKEIGKISGPTAITGLILYSRAMISMLFLGHLGELELAGGSLAIGVANITGYSVISGLAMGMEPICGQAYGAKQMKLLGLTLQRTILLLLTTSIPIAIMWLNMKRILLWCNQDEEISSMAQKFILFAIPDLFVLSFLHPLRIYLRTQGIILPLTYISCFSVLLHVPLNFLFVKYLKIGVGGVALAMTFTNLNLVIFLCSYIYSSPLCNTSWVPPSPDCLRGWAALLSLAVPTCISVCLEWWWYELMIILCGLLSNPKATIASMGILIQMTSFIYVFPSSLSLGVSTRVSNELGTRRPAKARISMIVSIIWSSVLSLFAMTFSTLMRHRWGLLFTRDKDILELTAAALPIAGLCELGNCPQTTGCGVLRGSARPTIGANINLGSFYLVGLPVALFMGYVMNLGFSGLWVGLLAAQGCCAVLMMLSLHRTDWVIQAERAQQLTGGVIPEAPLLPIRAAAIQNNVGHRGGGGGDESERNGLMTIDK